MTGHQRSLQLEPYQQQPLSTGVKKVLLRKDEVAELLNASLESVQRYIDVGELETVLVNSQLELRENGRRHIRVTTRSVEAFLNRRKDM